MPGTTNLEHEKFADEIVEYNNQGKLLVQPFAVAPTVFSVI